MHNPTMRIRNSLILAVSVLFACGDPAFDPSSTISSNGGPAGSTTNMGTVSALIDGEPFQGKLNTGATYLNGRFGFAGFSFDFVSRTLAVSVRAPGPGTMEAGGVNSPTISYIEGSGAELRRWTSQFKPGSGSFTLSFLGTDNASGYFSFELVPDAATLAAGVTNTRYLTNGTFNVSMSR